MAIFQLEEFRTPVQRQFQQASAFHRLNDDVATFDIRVLGKLDTAVKSAIENAHLRRPQRMRFGAIFDNELKCLKMERAADRPQQITQPPQIAFQPVGNGVANDR